MARYTRFYLLQRGQGQTKLSGTPSCWDTRFRQASFTPSQRGVYMCLDPYLVLDLFNSLCHNQSFQLRFQKLSALTLIHLPSMSAKRTLPSSRSNFEMCPFSRGGPDVQPTSMPEDSISPGLSTLYGVIN